MPMTVHAAARGYEDWLDMERDIVAGLSHAVLLRRARKRKAASKRAANGAALGQRLERRGVPDPLALGIDRLIDADDKQREREAAIVEETA